MRVVTGLTADVQRRSVAWRQFAKCMAAVRKVHAKGPDRGLTSPDDPDDADDADGASVDHPRRESGDFSRSKP